VLDPADRLAIHELINDYGHLIDEREFSRLAENMTPDVVYDMVDFGLGVAHGIEAVAAMWSGPEAAHPLAHHATNIVVVEEADGTVRVRSKGIGVGVKGRVGSVTYHDVVVKTAAGWRIAARTGVLRRPETIPPIS
jgi:ketosteroid isomerase-like protein